VRDAPDRVCVDADDGLGARVNLAGGEQESTVAAGREDGVRPVDHLLRVGEPVDETVLDRVRPDCHGDDTATHSN